MFLCFKNKRTKILKYYFQQQLTHSDHDTNSLSMCSLCCLLNETRTFLLRVPSWFSELYEHLHELFRCYVAKTNPSKTHCGLPAPTHLYTQGPVKNFFFLQLALTATI